jgi:hypothetical protein
MNKLRKSISLDGETHERLRRFAFKKNTTIAELVRQFGEKLEHS